MAVLKVTIPDDLLETPKSADELAEDVRLAVLMFWLARGMVRREQVPAGLRSTAVEVEPFSTPSRLRSPKEVLLAMPDLGDDALFERVRDYGRGDPGWDS